MLACQFLLSLAAAGLVSAQNTVTSMFVYGADPQPLVASILRGDATATTYSINCPPGTDASDCGMGPSMIVVAGPTTTVYKMDSPDPSEDFHMTVSCSVGGTTTAVCTQTASGSAANFPGVSASTFSSVPLLPVTITAGSAGTPATASATATTAAAASASGSGKSTSTASEDASKTSSAGSASSAASFHGSSPVSTGGVPQVTGNAGALFGAAAVALGVFAL